MVNGDIYCDYDFSHLPARADRAGQQRTTWRIWCWWITPNTTSRAIFCLHDDRVINSALSPQHSALTFSGIGLYNPHCLPTSRAAAKAPLAPLLREQIALGKVSGEHHRGIWVDVGTPQRLDELDKQLRASQNVRHD